MDMLTVNYDVMLTTKPKCWYFLNRDSYKDMLLLLEMLSFMLIYQLVSLMFKIIIQYDCKLLNLR